MAEQNAQHRKKPERTTKVSFTSSDLTTLGKLVSAGQMVFPTEHPVLRKLKAAMSRMGLPVPKGM